MLTHWNKLLNTDCIVIDVGPDTIYPIFKNGSSSLMAVADKTYINKQISNCNNINILLRDPEERFVSGINEYCKPNDLDNLAKIKDVKKTWELVYDGKIINRHFAPQWLWLFHLYKFYRGEVILKPFKTINDYCKIHMNKEKKQTNVALIKQFVEVDYELIENHLNKPILLEELIRKYKNVLS